ncbi:D-2-hydroxyacid dehydrogenase [Croceimicrobium sp.]|uniref:D-2-hydroxyacid dehydrogenase n=1 Tax=Croceimicrobium sp. TaxID=2828340 RepID=UPI003BAB7DB8
MVKILANDGISKSGEEALKAAGFDVDTTKVAQERLAEHINENGVDVLLVRSATKVRKDLIDATKGNLKFIGRGGVGMDNIDVDYAREQGMIVQNTPAASSRSVAELVFAHLSGMVRFVFDANQKMPLEGETNFKALKKNYGAGTELQGKTLGIIGFGRIGQEVAKIALGYGMQVKAVDPFVESADIKLEFFDGQSLNFTIKSESMDAVLAASDFITLHIAGAGKAIIGKAEIEKMKDNAGIINTARGGVVDEEALLEALESGKLKYAGLDVFVNEPTPAMAVLMSPYTSLTPHIGAATLEAQDRIGTEMAQHIIEAAKAW